MKKVLNLMTSALFIFAVLFLMAGLYSIESIKIERGVFHSLFNNLLFEILFILFTGALFLRAIYRKRLFSRLLYAGLILCLLPFFIFMKTDHHRNIRLKEGEQVSGIYLTKIKGIPDGLIVIGKERPERFRDIEAEIRIDERNRSIRPFPFTIVGTRAISLQDAGISPELEIRVMGSDARPDLLDLLPPGKVARLPLDNELSMHISLSPEKVYKKGRLDVSEFSLVRPSYRVVVNIRGKPVIEGIFRDGQQVYKEGILMEIKKTNRWVKFKQGNLFWIASFYTGLLLILSGLIIAIANLLRGAKTQG